MSKHEAWIEWRLLGGDFLRGKYSREHIWKFDGGTSVAASPSPSVVPVPYSNVANVDPEEAFVASIASCHMLTFLYLASREGFEILSYQDAAFGVMTKNERGVPWVASVVLSPSVEYDGTPPTLEQEQSLHDRAHEQCFISQSVKTEISVQPATRT
ncbi:MAG: OsmC family protein [Myxococcota bacterium]|jgi:organic hydroperoxide reductase OsmC/OhrA|nr:OsmC family protein [Myxococcota bacterium]